MQVLAASILEGLLGGRVQLLDVETPCPADGAPETWAEDTAEGATVTTVSQCQECGRLEVHVSPRLTKEA